MLASALLAPAADAAAHRPARGPEVNAPSPWELVFRDSFRGDTLDPRLWRRWHGTPANGLGGYWQRSHVRVTGGQLVLEGYREPALGNRWVTGGVGNRVGVVQAYGKYRVRMRLDDAYGLSYAVLLWPESNSAPPEIDFAEGFGRSMQRTKATVHSGTKEARVRTGQTLAVDMTKWHVVGVEWTPGLLRFTMDDKVWFTVAGTKVPRTPMVLDLQTEVHSCTVTVSACPDERSPSRMNMYVDWVEVYSYRGPL
jgi:beta-glucanase (GH16 family)